MKFLIIGDLHGAMPKIKVKDFDAIIAPGDFCSDKGIREAYAKAYKEYIKTHNMSKEWWDYCGKKKAKKYSMNSINRGRKILKFLDSFNKPVYLVPGNWDWTEGSTAEWSFMNKDYWKKYIMKGHKNIRDVHEKIVDIGEFAIIGYGICNGPELLKYRHYGRFPKKRHEKNQKAYDKLLDKYDKLFKRAKKPIIFITHNVPYNVLDLIKNRKSLMRGYHYGSLLARKMILKHKPLLCIGGHMHENYGKKILGKTEVINSGFGANVNTLVEINNKKLKVTKIRGSRLSVH